MNMEYWWKHNCMENIKFPVKSLSQCDIFHYSSHVDYSGFKRVAPYLSATSYHHQLCEIAEQAAHFHILGLEGGGFVCDLALAGHVVS